MRILQLPTASTYHDVALSAITVMSATHPEDSDGVRIRILWIFLPKYGPEASHITCDQVCRLCLYSSEHDRPVLVGQGKTARQLTWSCIESYASASRTGQDLPRIDTQQRKGHWRPERGGPSTGVDDAGLCRGQCLVSPLLFAQADSLSRLQVSREEILLCVRVCIVRPAQQLPGESGRHLLAPR